MLQELKFAKEYAKQCKIEELEKANGKRLYLMITEDAAAAAGLERAGKLDTGY